MHLLQLAPPTSLLPTNITTMGCFKISIVGALTSAQFITLIEKYLICNVPLIDILDFYKSNNPCYKHVELQLLQRVPLHTFSYILYVDPNYFKIKLLNTFPF
jgi:hypothetical protein